MMDSSGVIMFVQSSLPPSPTSIIAISTCCSAKYLKASAVVSSKKEAVKRFEETTFLRYKIDDILLRNHLSIDADTLTEIDEMWACVQSHPIASCCKIAASVCEQEPFPLVPAT